MHGNKTEVQCEMGSMDATLWQNQIKQQSPTSVAIYLV